MSSERNALVTGTSGELGAAIATRLANDGYRVVGLDLRAPAAAGSWQHYSCDLSDIAALGATLEQIRREVGPLRLLVNNAAYYNPVSFWDLSPEQIQRTMAVNVTAVMYLCQQVAKQMKDTGGGNIVNIASIAGRARQLADRLWRIEGGGHQYDGDVRTTARGTQHSRQCHRAGVDRRGHGQGPAAGGEGKVFADHAAEAGCAPARDRERRGISRQRRGELHHWQHCRCEWRIVSNEQSPSIPFRTARCYDSRRRSMASAFVSSSMRRR